jgi:hypothetical protein
MARKIILLILLPFLITGCNGLILPDNPVAAPTGVPAVGNTPVSIVPTQSEAVNPNVDNPIILTVWAPDNFAVTASDQSQQLLVDRLDTFKNAHPGVSVDLRIKSVQKQESLMELLNTTSQVAKSALPDVILLTREDMETAALKGLLVPFDGFLVNTDEVEIFNSFEYMGKLQGSNFGIPAAGDALIMVGSDYDQEPLLTWNKIQASDLRIGANLNDPDATVFVALYESAGGTLLDANGKPYLDKDALSQLLAMMRESRGQSVFPDWSFQVSDWTEVSKRYNAGQTDLMLNWYTNTRETSASGFVYQALPGLSDTQASTLTGWYWAIANPAPEKLSYSKELLTFLSQPVFSSTWSYTAGYLPVSKQQWPISDSRTLILQTILDSGHPIPDTSVRITLGPVIRDAAIRAYTTLDNLEEIIAAAIARVNQ